MIKLQCVIYQWIYLDKLYEQVESFYASSHSFLNKFLKTEKYSHELQDVIIGQISMHCISMDLSR